MINFDYCKNCALRNEPYTDCHTCKLDNGVPSNFEMKGVTIPVQNMNFEDMPTDAVNHPNHYTHGNIEVIDYIIDKLTGEQFEGYVIGNVLKYVSRYRHKGGFEDLKKANWYLSKLIETGERK